MQVFRLNFSFRMQKLAVEHGAPKTMSRWMGIGSRGLVVQASNSVRLELAWCVEAEMRRWYMEWRSKCVRMQPCRGTAHYGGVINILIRKCELWHIVSGELSSANLAGWMCLYGAIYLRHGQHKAAALLTRRVAPSALSRIRQIASWTASIGAMRYARNELSTDGSV